VRANDRLRPDLRVGAAQVVEHPPGKEDRVAVAPTHLRADDGGVRGEERVEDGANRVRAHKGRIDHMNEHRVHARPVRHG